VLAEADSQQAVLAGRGEAQRIMQVGLSEAAVLMQKVNSYGDPRLFALTHVGSQLAKSTQPLVPEANFKVRGLVDIRVGNHFDGGRRRFRASAH